MRLSVTVGMSKVLICAAPPPADRTPEPPIPRPAAASFRSSPEQKPRPSPVRIITRTSGSLSYSLSFSPSVESIATLIAFMRSGRLSLSVATCPVFSASKSLIANPPWRQRIGARTKSCVAQWRRRSKAYRRSASITRRATRIRRGGFAGRCARDRCGRARGRGGTRPRLRAIDSGGAENRPEWPAAGDIRAARARL